MNTNVTDEKMWHLHHCPLFAGVSMKEMKHLADITIMSKLEPQERIIYDPEHAKAIWMIKEGLLTVTYGDAEGKDATVMLLSPGDLFGAIDERQDLDYSQNVVALKPTVLCRMTQQQMEALMHKYPGMGYRLTKFSWRRIARLQQRLAEIMTKSVKVRLVGSSREMVSKVMGGLRDNGWVRSARKSIDRLEVEVLSNTVESG